jgi:hypothetical protein
VIKPEQYVDQDSVVTAWDDALRLVVTIKLLTSQHNTRHHAA